MRGLPQIQAGDWSFHGREWLACWISIRLREGAGEDQVRAQLNEETRDAEVA